MNSIQRFQPTTLAELQQVSEVFFRSGYFADVTDAAKAMVKIMFGSELGLGPMTSLQGIQVIKGKPSLSANVQASLVKSSKKYDYRLRENSPQVVSIEFFQREGDKWESLGTSTFTLEDGRKAGTQNLDKFPRNMLFARAMSNGVKWFCPDLTNAPIYTPEELGAEVNEDGEPILNAITGDVLMANGHQTPAPIVMITDDQAFRIENLGELVYKDKWLEKEKELVNYITKGVSDYVSELTTEQAEVMLKGLSRKAESLTPPEEQAQPAPNVKETAPVPDVSLTVGTIPNDPKAWEKVNEALDWAVEQGVYDSRDHAKTMFLGVNSLASRNLPEQFAAWFEHCNKVLAARVQQA